MVKYLDYRNRTILLNEITLLLQNLRCRLETQPKYYAEYYKSLLHVDYIK